MTNIGHADRQIKPSAIRAYIDTIEVFFRRGRYRQAVERGERFTRIGDIRPCTLRNGFIIGYRLIVNDADDPLTLQQLARVMQRYGGVLSRVDIAVDMQMATAAAAQALREWILQHAKLRWRRGPMDDQENGTYWVQLQKGQRRYPRNLVLYADAPNRHTGEPHCVHLELRFFNADSIRRQHITNVSDLIDSNPNILFAKHVKWSDVADRYVSNTIRKAVKADRQRQYSRHPYTDPYRAHLKERVKAILQRNGSDRAQNHKETGGKSMPTGNLMFDIPEKLIWRTEIAIDADHPSKDSKENDGTKRYRTKTVNDADRLSEQSSIQRYKRQNVEQGALKSLTYFEKGVGDRDLTQTQSSKSEFTRVSR